MRLRSLLFVPGDRPDRFEKAADSGADALIVDLEDSVALEAKPAARQAVADWLKARPEIPVFVRINPLDSTFVRCDLDAILPHRPYGIVLPKAEGAADIARLDALMSGAALPILPIATETPAAVFELSSFRTVGQRLAGLTWGAEDLPAAIGASRAREDDGGYTDPYRMVRSLALFAAHAAGVSAIETVYPDIRDEAGLAAYAARGRRDGFAGMMALHPAQVPIINAGFAPTPEEIAHARAVVEAFAANPGAGVLQVDGRMVDRPHLESARDILARKA